MSLVARHDGAMKKKAKKAAASHQLPVRFDGELSEMLASCHAARCPASELGYRPVAHFKFDQPKSVSPVILSPEQEAALQAQLVRRDLRTMRLAVLIGLRCGQFFSLRWDWLLWDLSAFRIPGFKGQHARIVAIPQEGVKILTVMYEEQGKPSSRFLFPHATKKGAPVVANDWYRYHFKAAAKMRKIFLAFLKISLDIATRCNYITFNSARDSLGAPSQIAGAGAATLPGTT